MNIDNLKIQKILEFLVIYFPVFFFLRSFILNLVLIIISIIFIYICIQNKLNFFKNIFNKLFVLFILYLSVLQLFIYEDYNFFFKSLFLLKFFFLVNANIFVWSNMSLKKFKEKLKYLNIVFIIFIFDIYYQYIFQQNIFGFQPGFCSGSDNECIRFSGIFDQEFIAGAYISIVGVSLFISSIILKKKFVNFLIPIILFITIFITGERTALIFNSIFVIFFYSLFFKDIKNKLKILSIIFITLFLLFNFVITETSKNRFSTSTLVDLNIKNHYLKNLTLADQLKLTSWGLHYRASLLMIMDKPIFGNGLKSYRYKCAEYEYLKYILDSDKRVRKSAYEVCTTHPHQFHLEILTDSGIVGYLLFIILIVTYLRNIYTLKNKLDSKHFILIILFLLTLIFFPRPTGSIFSTTFGSMFWYALATLYGSIKFYLKNKKILNKELN